MSISRKTAHEVGVMKIGDYIELNLYNKLTAKHGVLYINGFPIGSGSSSNTIPTSNSGANVIATISNLNVSTAINLNNSFLTTSNGNLFINGNSIIGSNSIPTSNSGANVIATIGNLKTDSANIINLTGVNLLETNISTTSLNSSYATTTSLNSSFANVLNLNATNISVGSIIDNGVILIPSRGDIFTEMSFNGSNNILSPQNITNFSFSSNVRYVKSDISITLVTNTNTVVAGCELKAVNNGTNWVLSTSFIGGITGIKFYIVSGQIRYTSPNTTNFVSLLFKFKATTLSI